MNRITTIFQSQTPIYKENVSELLYDEDWKLETLFNEQGNRAEFYVVDPDKVSKFKITIDDHDFGGYDDSQLMFFVDSIKILTKNEFSETNDFKKYLRVKEKELFNLRTELRFLNNI